MRSTFVPVFIKLILTAYLTCTNAGPVASGPAGHDFSNSNFNAPVLFGNENRVTSKTIVGAGTDDSKPATPEPTCETDGHEICTCEAGYSYQSAPKPQCTPGSKTLPSDLFCYAGIGKCFKFIEQKMTWDKAVAKCQTETLFLAEPEPGLTKTIRNYLQKTYGNNIGDTWLGAKGDAVSRSQKWKERDTKINPSNTLWLAKGGIEADYNCLILLTNKRDSDEKPDQPLYIAGCSREKHVLCQMV